MRRRYFVTGAISATFAAHTRGARAERALAIVIPDLPGGEGGTAGRILQPYLERALARPVVLDFRPGAGGIVGLTAGSQAAPDGATLTLLTPAVTLAPWLSRRMDCAPADFAAVGQVSFTPAMLVVRADGPHRRLADLLAAPPGALTAPAASGWGPADMAQALFLSRAKLRVREISGLTTGAERIAALRAGDVDLAFVRVGQELAPDLLAIAVSGPAREPLMAAVPSLRETGFDVVAGAWRALAAPAGTPAALVEQLGAAVKAVMDNAAARAELTGAGLAPAWLGPAASGRAVAAEYSDAGKLFASLGITVRKEMLGSRTG